MQITTTKRNEFEPRIFMGGRVSPQLDIDWDNRDRVLERAEIAKGVTIDGTWYELPDHADGEYVLIEQLRTNFYGYYEGQGSERELLTRAEADQVVGSVGRGIVKQVAVISVSGEVVQCHRDEVELFRKQGM